MTVVWYLYLKGHSGFLLRIGHRYSRMGVKRLFRLLQWCRRQKVMVWIRGSLGVGVKSGYCR